MIPRITTAVLAVLIVLGATAVAEAQGRVLLTVTEVDASGVERYWWEDAASPAWTRSDQELTAALREIGLDVLDPSSEPDAPSISNVVYGHPHLSATNAINLASLFGASKVITGSVVYQNTGATPVLHRQGVCAIVDLHVYASNTTIEILPITLHQRAYAATADQAMDAAIERIVDRVRPLLQHSASLSEARVGITVDEPLLVITGLTEAAPLVEIKRQLKTRPDVEDVVEIWAAEGVIAVELNPQRIDAAEEFTQAVDALLQHSFDGFTLQEVGRDPHHIEVSVVRRRPGA